MYTIRTIRIKCILIFVYFCIVLLTATCWTAVLPRVELNAKMQKGLMVKAGATVLLEAEVFGKPMPKVTWKRGDTSLRSTEGLTISNQRQQFQLEMTSVTKEHSGTYTITAQNASGSKTAEVIVKVLGASRLSNHVGLRPEVESSS